MDRLNLNEKGFWEVAELSQALLVASHSEAHGNWLRVLKQTWRK